jgi:hypothetical protein
MERAATAFAIADENQLRTSGDHQSQNWKMTSLNGRHVGIPLDLRLGCCLRVDSPHLTPSSSEEDIVSSGVSNR